MASRWDCYLEEDTFSQQMNLHRINCCEEPECIKSMPATTMEEMVRRIKMARNRPEVKTYKVLPHLMNLNNNKFKKNTNMNVNKNKFKKTTKRIRKKILRTAPEIVGAIVKTNYESSKPIETDQEKQLAPEVNDKSYIEEVNDNPFFEDSTDMWLSLTREEAETEENLLKRKQRSKLKLKLKKKK